MNQVLPIYKPLGKTPLQVLDQLRLAKPELQDQKLSYAGRLDPMAQGLMLVLVGEANKKREKYLALNKTYDFEMVLGISTDSYDLLGLVTKVNKGVDEVNIKELIKSFIGTNSLPYPPYSSKTVGGKPLWWWAKKEKLDQIDIPTNSFEVFKFDSSDQTTISSHEMISYIKQKIALVSGDFRQQQIIETWDQRLKDINTHFPLYKLSLHCSSGTYVRSIVHHLGQKLSTGAVTYSINRIHIGNI